ncbi:MAG TPA: hypothetical protein VFG76_02690, partial [Candidatus Polarisedimenticolia bacterium]|nr:hypothetical protein [Candidatus Polarisedimenticolia bacterium]
MEYTHGVPRAAARTIITAGLLIAAVSASLAHQGRPLGQSGPGPERSGWPPAQTLVRYPAEIELPQDLLTQEGLRRSHPGVGEFLKRHPAWSATVDPYSGSIERAFGDGVPLEPGEAGEAEAARGFLRHHGALLAGGLDLSESSLVFNEDLSRPLAGAGTRIAHFDLRRDDIPVLGAGVTLGIRDGMVFYISTSSLRPVATSPVAKLTSGQAVERLEAHLERAGADPGPLSLQKEAQLAFYPTLEQHGVSRMMRYRLIWILNVKPEAAPFYLSHIAYVDAHDGDVLALFPEALNIGACVSDPGQTKGTVIGGIRPNRADDAEVLRQLPFAQVQVGNVKLSCDVNGHYPYVGGPASSQINGQFFRSHCDTCQTPAQPSAPADETGRIDFGVGGVSEMPVSGNGRSTAADRTAYYHLNQTRRLLGKWNNAFFDEIDTYVNILDFCNAFSSGYLLGFFTGDPACHNTGEIRNVVEHELGHTWDRFDGTGITSGSTSEWKGDVLALLSGGDSCVGESFFLTGGPTSACSGVRDIDEKAPGRTDHPLTPAVCPTCATLTRTVNGCGGGTHCQGEIIGQASWHLLNNLLTGTDYITGASLGAGNGALPVEQARWILERLLIGGGPPMVTFNPLAAGVSVYDALMLIDDEDGNLANGTPHAAYINAAFSHHELQEAPLIADAAACAPLSDPIVSAVVDRDAATGLPAVRLTWTPVGGATNFDVLRNERAGDAFFPIAQNVAAGPILDTGVQVGVTYRYLVAAVRKTGCAEVSPGANVATVAVVPPELRVFGHVFSEAPVGADGDGRIEPGERARVQVTLRETGGGSPATGVSALVTSDSPASPMTLGGPVGFGTVPSGGTAPGASAYEVFVGPSEPCGASIPLALSATGNEG